MGGYNMLTANEIREKMKLNCGFGSVIAALSQIYPSPDYKSIGKNKATKAVYPISCVKLVKEFLMRKGYKEVKS
jgi:hypothetical protein